MIIGIILRAIFFYFLWQLARRLWSSYVLSQKHRTQTPSSRRTNSNSTSNDVFEADFRVINEQDL